MLLQNSIILGCKDREIFEFHSEMALQHFQKVEECTEFAVTKLKLNLGLHHFSGQSY